MNQSHRDWESSSIIKSKKQFCYQKRMENLSTLSLSRQLYAAEVNYRGSLAKRERENTLEQGKAKKAEQLARDQKLVGEVRTSVSRQKYMSNTHRIN